MGKRSLKNALSERDFRRINKNVEEIIKGYKNSALLHGWGGTPILYIDNGVPSLYYQKPGPCDQLDITQEIVDGSVVKRGLCRIYHRRPRYCRNFVQGGEDCLIAINQGQPLNSRERFIIPLEQYNRDNRRTKR